MRMERGNAALLLFSFSYFYFCIFIFPAGKAQHAEFSNCEHYPSFRFTVMILQSQTLLLIIRLSILVINWNRNDHINLWHE